VRIDAAPADAVTAWNRQDGLPESAEQWPSQKHRPANLLKKLGSRPLKPRIFRTQAHRRALFLHTHAHVRKQLEHGAHIPDAWHVPQGDFTLGKENGG